MSDFKAKLPDIKELTSMASKLFKDVKTSVSEIIKNYKQKRGHEAASPKAKPKKEEGATAAKTAKTKTAKKESSEKKKPD